MSGRLQLLNLDQRREGRPAASAPQLHLLAEPPLLLFRHDGEVDRGWTPVRGAAAVSRLWSAATPRLSDRRSWRTRARRLGPIPRRRVPPRAFERPYGENVREFAPCRARTRRRAADRAVAGRAARDPLYTANPTGAYEARDQRGHDDEAEQTESLIACAIAAPSLGRQERARREPTRTDSSPTGVGDAIVTTDSIGACGEVVQYWCGASA